MQKLHEIFHSLANPQTSFDDVKSIILNSSQFAQLEQTLGHQFKCREYLVTALIHPSLGNEILCLQDKHYQRFEFLGDSILGLLLAEKLFNTFPTANEGELSKMKAHLAGQEMLIKLGLALGLENYIIFGKGTFHQLESKQGLSKGMGRALADVVESLLAALWLDCGWEKTRVVLEKITHLYAEEYQKDYLDFETFLEFDPKSKLQEKCLSIHKVLPIYELESCGDRTLCKLWLNGELIVSAFGGGRREAEKMAAREALTKLFVNIEPK